MILNNQLCLIYDNISNILKNHMKNCIIYSDDMNVKEECKNNDQIVYEYKSSYIRKYKKLLKKIENNKILIQKFINILPKELTNIITNYYEDNNIYVIFHYSSYDNHIVRSRLIDKYLKYEYPNRKIILILMENNILIEYHRLIKWRDVMSFTLPKNL